LIIALVVALHSSPGAGKSEKDVTDGKSESKENSCMVCIKLFM
jgi:hypothetical protein